jgi:hypothetical protein
VLHSWHTVLHCWWWLLKKWLSLLELGLANKDWLLELRVYLCILLLLVDLSHGVIVNIWLSYLMEICFECQSIKYHFLSQFKLWFWSSFHQLILCKRVPPNVPENFHLVLIPYFSELEPLPDQFIFFSLISF